MISIKRNSVPYRLLKGLALGAGIVLLGSLNPSGGSKMVKELFKEYFGKKKIDAWRLKRDLKSLQSRELLDYKELPGGQIRIKLTKRGREVVLMGNFDNIKLKKPKIWDGRWRLVMFDIPHKNRKMRDLFRMKLVELGFFPIQKSVFICPYPCEDEIDFTASVLQIRDKILLMNVSDFEGDAEFIKAFKLI